MWIIGLAAGAIFFSFTFLDSLPTAPKAKWLIQTGWILLGISFVLGLFYRYCSIYLVERKATGRPATLTEQEIEKVEKRLRNILNIWSYTFNGIFLSFGLAIISLLAFVLVNY